MILVWFRFRSPLHRLAAIVWRTSEPPHESANDFQMAFQHITTEWCWGYAWNRPGLDRKTRSMLNLAMLTALNRAPEIKLHTRGAINNGVSVDEIKEVLLHATVYCGIPAGLDAFKAANEVLKDMGKVK